MKHKLHTNSESIWLTKLMPFDYAIEYKKGVKNKVVDALTRIHGAELMSLVISTTNYDLLHAIVESWETYNELKTIFEQLQANPTSHSQFTWSNNRLRRKGRLVVGKVLQLRKIIMNL